jgi:hypothetical protein
LKPKRRPNTPFLPSKNKFGSDICHFRRKPYQFQKRGLFLARNTGGRQEILADSKKYLRIAR